MQIHCLEYDADGKLMNHLWWEQQRNSVIILGFLIWSIFVGVGELKSDLQTGCNVTLALEPISLSCFRPRALTLCVPVTTYVVTSDDDLCRHKPWRPMSTQTVTTYVSVSKPSFFGLAKWNGACHVDIAPIVFKIGIHQVHYVTKLWPKSDDVILHNFWILVVTLASTLPIWTRIL